MAASAGAHSSVETPNLAGAENRTPRGLITAYSAHPPGANVAAMSAVQALAPSALAPTASAAAPSRLRSLSPYLLLVANGNASGLNRRPHLVQDSAQLLRSAGARVETRVTTSLEELDWLLATAERRVVLLGGDGSVHAAANSRGRAELALIPAGGANNIARSLGIPADFAAAARLAVDGRARSVDAISVETPSQRYLAVEGISVGFHAIARAQYTAKNSADVSEGIRAGMRAVTGFVPPTIALSLDGSCRLVTIAQLFVANMPLFGPSLRVAPADPADALLDVVTIEGGRRTLLALAPRLRRGTHLQHASVSYARAGRIKISTRGRSPIIADTTNVGDTAELTVVPGALEIVGAAA
jgi:diacylglycerol kinase family enzyme